jgi:hypothetical protein
MQHCVVTLKLADVSEVRTSSIIRVMMEARYGWLLLLWWRQYAPPKRRLTSTWLHSATSQKTLNFILAAVRTGNLTCLATITQYYKLLIFVFRGFYCTDSHCLNDSVCVLPSVRTKEEALWCAALYAYFHFISAQQLASSSHLLCFTPHFLAFHSVSDVYLVADPVACNVFCAIK